MIEITRAEFKEDPVFNAVFEVIKRNHVVPEHTKTVLVKNGNVKDFCVEARHFAILGDKPSDSYYIHYDVSNWYNSDSEVQVRFEKIAFYNNFQQYESARLRALHSSIHVDGVNLN